MIFKLLLAFFCCFAIISAIDTDSTVVTENTKETELYVHKNSIVTVFLEGYYDTTDERTNVTTVFETGEDRWILENVQELAESGHITPLNLTNSNWGDVPNASANEHQINVSDLLGVMAEFSFKVDEDITANTELPSLKFTFKSKVKEDRQATVKLVLTDAEVIDIHEFKFNSNAGTHDEEKVILHEFYFTYHYSTEARIGNQSYLMIILDGQLARKYAENKKMEAEYHWYIDNEKSKELMANGEEKPFSQCDYMELVNTASFYGDHQAYVDNIFEEEMIQYALTFRIKEINKKTEKLSLVFNYKASEDDAAAADTRLFELKNMNELDYDGLNPMILTEYNYNVPLNGLVKIGVKGSSDNEWRIENLDEVKNSTYMDLLQLSDGDGDGNEDKPVYVNGAYIFKFHIKGSSKSGTVEPILKFVNADQSKSITICFYVKQKTLNDLIPTYEFDMKDEGFAYVERNSLLKVKVYKDIYGHYHKKYPQLSNLGKDIIIGNSNVELVDVIFKSCLSTNVCTFNKDVFYVFLVKNVKSDEELPTIKIGTSREAFPSLLNRPSSYREITLKLKKPSKVSDASEACPFNGYQCCSKVHPMVYYQDEDGDWGYENDQWCFVLDSINTAASTTSTTPAPETPELIRVCKEYPCCTDRTKVTDVQQVTDGYREKFSKVGLQDGQKCNLPNCVYTGDYPVCEETTEVAYTDTEKWGIEHGHWCVLCI